MHEELLYLLALSNVSGLGPVKAKSLLKHVGSAREIFRQKRSTLCLIPEIGQITAHSLSQVNFDKAEKEVEFLLREGINAVTWPDSHYPQRLRSCDDSPIVLFGQGKFDWNPVKAISIVGTRKCDSYGRQVCQSLIEAIKPHSPTVISGLAHGIDAAAHIAAIENGLPTLGCVAHGLDKLYPPPHKPLADRMKQHGGLVSEFFSKTAIAPEMFPMRNRIIAGMSDCTIVIQTDIKGGSMITAHIAQSYGREVFAVPGRVNDRLSRGCHKLIKTNIAAILTSAEDLVNYMQWDQNAPVVQSQLIFPEPTDSNATAILKALQIITDPTFDDLLSHTNLSWGLLNSTLLQLEFDGLIRALPGKRYRLGR
jgi:DNA processing protein